MLNDALRRPKSTMSRATEEKQYTRKQTEALRDSTELKKLNPQPMVETASAEQTNLRCIIQIWQLQIAIKGTGSERRVTGGLNVC